MVAMRGRVRLDGVAPSTRLRRLATVAYSRYHVPQWRWSWELLQSPNTAVLYLSSSARGIKKYQNTVFMHILIMYAFSGSEVFD